jgi:uncharacterized protein (DUF2062 family)
MIACKVAAFTFILGLFSQAQEPEYRQQTMPRETIKRYLPSPTKLRKIKALRVLGEWIYEPNLWHINRHSTSLAFFVGLFVAFMPIPSQMVLASLLAIWLRCNLPIAIGLCWVTNPVTMGPIFWFTYKLGALVLGEPAQTEQFEVSVEWLTDGLVLIWQPLLLGGVISGFFFGSLGYFSIQALWRWSVLQRWEARARRRLRTREKATRDVALRQAVIARRVERGTSPPESKAAPPRR